MADILFLTRGHGFGHAARDLRIIEELRKRPDVTVRIMATGTAVDYYRMRGVDCVEVDVADGHESDRASAERVWEAMAAQGRPDLVVSDEVMWALPFARARWRQRCVVVLCALYAEYGLPHLDRLLDQADELLVLDFPQNRPDRCATTAPVTFAGPVVRGFPLGRSEARARLGLDPAEEVAVLSLGGMATRSESRRMAGVALQAWSDHAPLGSRMFVLADPPEQESGLPTGADSAGRIVWTGVTSEPETYYAAADLVLNDAMGSALFDLVWNRVPAVALVDEESLPGFPASFRRRVDHLAEAGLVDAVTVRSGPQAVWGAMQSARRRAGRWQEGVGPTRFTWSSGASVAARLLAHLGG
jgi:hypothetical protein